MDDELEDRRTEASDDMDDATLLDLLERQLNAAEIIADGTRYNPRVLRAAEALLDHVPERRARMEEALNMAWDKYTRRLQVVRSLQLGYQLAAIFEEMDWPRAVPMREQVEEMMQELLLQIRAMRATEEASTSGRSVAWSGGRVHLEREQARKLVQDAVAPEMRIAGRSRG